jgi:hypothetical protein
MQIMRQADIHQDQPDLGVDAIHQVAKAVRE